MLGRLLRLILALLGEGEGEGEGDGVGDTPGGSRPDERRLPSPCSRIGLKHGTATGERGQEG